MKAVIKGRVLADSSDTVEVGGYHYFPRASVRTDWLKQAPKNESDNECPHGVRFYDVVVDGERHERAAWSYEAPLPKMSQVADRFGFWEDVEVG
ncbi:MAG: DUF427 domain-containing protein [Alphaproteobacteria bacterium]|nr:DUF427 domain-containing protein [Alphaproteobacteria bacterium]